MSIRPRILIAGIGNAFRSDDGAGLLAAHKLAKVADAGVVVIEVVGDGTALMDAWNGIDHAILIDATSSGCAPGTVCRLDAGAQCLPVQFSHHSTHSINIAETIEFGRILGRLPRRVTVFGVEGQNFAHGTEISAPVLSGIAEIIRLIAEEITCTNNL